MLLFEYERGGVRTYDTGLEEGYKKGYAKGFDDGYNIAKKEVIEKLEELKGRLKNGTKNINFR